MPKHVNDASHRGLIAKPPFLIILTIAALTFVAETLVMLLLQFLPLKSTAVGAVLDATLLVVLISPALYFFLLRPLVAQVNERIKLEDILRKNEEEQFNAMVRTSMDGFWVTDVRGRFLEVNDAYCQLVGYSRDELLNLGVSDVEAIETPEETARHIAELIEHGSTRSETRHRCKDGRLLDMEVSANFTQAYGGRICSFLRDITERKHSEEVLRESEARLNEMFENLSSGVAVFRPSPDGRNFTITAFNKAAERIENIARHNVIGKDVVEAFPGVAEFGLLEVFRRTWISEVPEHFPVSFYQDGRISGWRDNYVYKLPNGEIVAIYDDVTKEKQAEEMLHHLAHHDALTGLPNRTLATDRIRQAIAMARRNKGHLALMFVDLDNFKPVNDNYGHDVGDRLLKDVARRLLNCVRESDTVSRIGGDEFLVVLSNIVEQQHASLVAEKVLRSLRQPFDLAEHRFHIASSIGISVYPEHGEHEKQLIKNADAAMYYAKSGGRNCARLYDPNMESGA